MVGVCGGEGGVGGGCFHACVFGGGRGRRRVLSCVCVCAFCSYVYLCAVVCVYMLVYGVHIQLSMVVVSID